MTWIRRQPPLRLHQCATPQRDMALMDFAYEVPDGQRGDVWRCDVCGKLWYRNAFDWHPATPWQRFRAKEPQ